MGNLENWELYTEQTEELYNISQDINFDRIGMSYTSLDQAITGVICYKYDGANSQANKFLWKMIK
jgi:hypothetical protein